MAKGIRQIADADFDSLMAQIDEAKTSIKGWEEHLKKLEAQAIERFSEIDQSSDFEGAESMESESYRLKLTYKLTRKVDKATADQEIRRLGLRPEELFIVKYDYSSSLYSRLDDEKREAVLDSMTTKRAKTSVEITRKERDNG